MSMGNWKSKIIRKNGKRSFTKSTKARLVAYLPPEGGWAGTHSMRPEQVNQTGRKTQL